MEDFEKVLDRLQESFEGRICKGSEKPPWEGRPTGIAPLDYALEIGGFPKGAQVEIYGPEQIGKTTLALLGAAETQRRDPEAIVAFVDVEHAWSPEWAAKQGVDIGRLLYLAPKEAEQAADMMSALTKEPSVKYIIFDSIGHLMSYKEYSSNAGDATYAGASKIVARMCREVSINIDPMTGTGATVIWINQIRANFTPMSHTPARPGGYVLGHADAVRIRLRKGRGKHTVKYQDFGDKLVGYPVVAIIEKSKVGPPKRSAWWWYNFEEIGGYKFGVDVHEANVRILIYSGLISKKGAMYEYDGPAGSFKVRGEATLREKLADGPELMAALIEELHSTLQGKEFVMDTSEESKVDTETVSLDDLGSEVEDEGEEDG